MRSENNDAVYNYWRELAMCCVQVLRMLVAMKGTKVLTLSAAQYSHLQLASSYVVAGRRFGNGRHLRWAHPSSLVCLLAGTRPLFNYLLFRMLSRGLAIYFKVLMAEVAED